MTAGSFMEKFKCARDGSKTRLSLLGRFTIEDKAVFQEFTEQNLGDSGGALCVDVSELEYIDSSGIGDLIKLKMGAVNRYDRICLLGMSENIERVFRMAGINQIFEVIDEEGYAAL